MHHALCGHHQPRLHVVDHVLGGRTTSVVTPSVLVRTVKACTAVPKFAGDLRMNEQAFVAIAALREVLTLFLWVDELTLGLSFVTLRPVLASNLDFACMQASSFTRFIS